MTSFVANATTALDRRPLPRWLLISAGLHLGILLLWLPNRPRLDVEPDLEPLEVSLSPRPVTAPPVIATRPPEPGARRSPRVTASPARPATTTTTELTVPAPAAAAEPAPPRIDLEAAMGTARRYGREPPPRRLPTDPVEKVLTVEAAVARATEPDVIVEKRGNAGEYIIEGKRFRCVQPLHKPFFLDGMMAPALCTSKR